MPRLGIEPRPGLRVVSLAPPAPSRTLAALWQPGRLSHAAEAFLALCLPPTAREAARQAH
jgi:hypothetical protein